MIRRLPVRFLFALFALLAWTAPAAAQLTLGSYYDAHHFDSRDRRLKQFPIFQDTGFKLLASAFTPADGDAGGILEACQAAAVDVLYELNTGSPDDHAKNWNKFTCVKWWNAQDDANLASTPAAVKAKIAAMRPKLRPGMGAFITLSKSADPAVWGPAATTADVTGIQLYINKEGTIRKWCWDYVKAWDAATPAPAKLWVHPSLIKNSLPYGPQPGGLPYTADPKWKVQEYTPAAYNEAAIWACLCAGADDVLYYSAYAVNPSYYPDYANVLERTDLQPAYKAINARIRFYERFFNGTRVTYEEGPSIVGARWTLPATGETLTVRVDTFEALPRVDWTITVPTKPQPAIVTQTPTGFTVELKP